MNRKFMGGLVLFLFIAVLGVSLSLIYPVPSQGDKFEPPSFQHLLGTDHLGKDFLTLVGYGIVSSVIIGFLAGLIAIALGTVIGAVSGFREGWIGESLNSISNIFLVIPAMALLIALSSALQVRSIFVVAVAIGLITWAWGARTIRSQVLSLKTREFMDMAKISGLKDHALIFRELLPNMLSYILLVFMIQFGSAIVTEAGISMIGLGPTSGTSLGQLLYWSIEGHALNYGAWWVFVVPGLLITLLASALLAMHAGMEEYFNPRLRKR